MTSPLLQKVQNILCVCVSVHVVFPHLPTNAGLQPCAKTLLLPFLFFSNTCMQSMPIFMSLYTCQFLVQENMFYSPFQSDNKLLTLANWQHLLLYSHKHNE